MERKAKHALKVALVAIFAFCFSSLTVKAATSTVGAGGGLKGNGVNSTVVLPNQPNTPVAFTVVLASGVPTQIVAADANRAALFFENASTNTWAGGATPRSPIIYITTSAATNMGGSAASPITIANQSSLKGFPLVPCMNLTSLANTAMGGGKCFMDYQGVTVPRNAFFAVAEASGAVISGVYFDP